MSERLRLPTPVCQAMEQAIAIYLGDSLQAKNILHAMRGRAVAIELRELNLVFYMLSKEDGMHVKPDYDDEPAATVSGTLPAMLRAGILRDGIPEGVRFGGDVELGQNFQKLLQEIDFDWEEQLARVVGDLAARQIGNVVRSLHGWSKQTLKTLGKDIAEYLQEETGDLPRREEVTQFINDVDELRDAVERTAARASKVLNQCGNKL